MSEIAACTLIQEEPDRKKALDEMNRLKGESHTADYDQKAVFREPLT